MKKLDLLIGCTNHTAATLSQILKMGVSPDQVMVVDQDHTKHGSVALTAPREGSVRLPYFDSVIEELNQGKYRNPESYIYTKIGNDLHAIESTWSKADQLSCLRSEANLGTMPDSLIVPSFRLYQKPQEAFVRRDRVHGGKGAGTMSDLLGDSPILVCDKAPDEYTTSLVLQADVIDGMVVAWDLLVSPSGFKDYADIFTIQGKSYEDTDFTPYCPNYIISTDARGFGYSHSVDHFEDVAQFVADACNVREGMMSTELFCTRDLQECFYIETNFRSADIVLATSPAGYAYVRRQLIAKGVIEE